MKGTMYRLDILTDVLFTRGMLSIVKYNHVKSIIHRCLFSYDLMDDALKRQENFKHFKKQSVSVSCLNLHIVFKAHFINLTKLKYEINF